MEKMIEFNKGGQWMVTIAANIEKKWKQLRNGGPYLLQMGFYSADARGRIVNTARFLDDLGYTPTKLEEGGFSLCLTMILILIPEIIAQLIRRSILAQSYVL